jgi:hypothetical protein
MASSLPRIVRAELPPSVAEQEQTKMPGKPTPKITLTAEQKEQIRQATGKAVTALKLQPLEERFAPSLVPN